MGLGESLMKIVVKVRDAVALARRFETSPREALLEVVEHVRDGVRHTLEEVMDAEIEMFLGQPVEKSNKRNGYVTRSFGISRYLRDEQARRRIGQAGRRRLLRDGHEAIDRASEVLQRLREDGVE